MQIEDVLHASDEEVIKEQSDDDFQVGTDMQTQQNKTDKQWTVPNSMHKKKPLQHIDVFNMEFTDLRGDDIANWAGNAYVKRFNAVIGPDAYLALDNLVRIHRPCPF